MNHAARSKVARHCVRLFDHMQLEPKEVQLLSLAAAFILMSDAYGYPAQDAFTVVKNLMADPLTSTGLGLQFDAMKWHLKTDLAHDA